MSIAPVELSLKLANQKVKFTGTVKTQPETTVNFDYVPPLGDGEGFLGLEMLAMAFAGCVSTAIVVMLRKTGKELAGYEMNVTGIKREQPLSLERIEFNSVIQSNNLSGEEVESAIKKAKQISPVWMAIKNNVEVSWKYEIISPN